MMRQYSHMLSRLLNNECVWLGSAQKYTAYLIIVMNKNLKIAHTCLLWLSMQLKILVCILTCSFVKSQQGIHMHIYMALSHYTSLGTASYNNCRLHLNAGYSKTIVTLPPSHKHTWQQLRHARLADTCIWSYSPQYTKGYHSIIHTKTITNMLHLQFKHSDHSERAAVNLQSVIGCLSTRHWRDVTSSSSVQL